MWWVCARWGARRVCTSKPITHITQGSNIQSDKAWRGDEKERVNGVSALPVSIQGRAAMPDYSVNTLCNRALHKCKIQSKVATLDYCVNTLCHQMPLKCMQSAM